MHTKFPRAMTVLLPVAVVLTALYRALVFWLVPGWSLQMIFCDVWIAVLLAASLCLLWLDRKVLTVRRRPGAPWRTPLAAAYFLSGFVLLFGTLAELFLWLHKGVLPPPSLVKPHAVELAALFLQMVCGLTGGVWLAAIGLCTMNGKKPASVWLRAGGLLPALWAWMLLARYEISYVSALDIGQSFFDFAVLVTGLLFLFRLAQYHAGTGEGMPRMMWAFSALAALFSLSAGLFRLALLIGGEKVTSYQGGYVLTLPQLGVGLLALAVFLSLQYGEKEPSAEEAGPSGEGSAPSYDKEVAFILEEADLPVTAPAADPAPEQTPEPKD